MSVARTSAAVGAILGIAISLAGAADPAAAERQYRIARRLVADGSDQAPAALEKVVDLDPSGPLADDARVDHALWFGMAAWPEELGAIDAAALAQGSVFLRWVLDHHPDSDRANEARYLLALARLEPAGDFNPQAARLGLLEVTSREPGGAWDRRARYARAWSDEAAGRTDAAFATYQRLRVDAAGTEAAVRARVGQARLLVRRGENGQAARLLQEAASGDYTTVAADALRELAIRSLLRDAGRLPAAGAFETVVPETEIKLFADMAALPDGGVLLAGRRAGVLRYRADGSLAARWNVDRPQVVAVGPDGTPFAANEAGVHRLDAGAEPVLVAGLGDSAPISGLAVDRGGTFWVLDRKGDRVLSVAAGTPTPREVWRIKGRRLDGIAWDGDRLVAVESRAGQVVEIRPDGTDRTVAFDLGDRPSVVAADPGGRLAVLDGKLGSVTLIARDGSVTDSFDLRDRGVGRGVTLRLGMDGRLHVYDGDGAWRRSP